MKDIDPKYIAIDRHYNKGFEYIVKFYIYF